VLANEPDSRTKPEFQHLEERPAAFWKKHQESRKIKLSRKEIALRLNRSACRTMQ
jgi:hypothetical protein